MWGDSDIRRHHSERARLTRAAASCFYFSANITPLYFHSSCGRVEECAWSFLGLHDPGVARVSDEGGEVSGSPEKPASTSTDTQVRVLHMGPASWQPGALLSCVGPEALLSCVRAVSSVSKSGIFMGATPKIPTVTAELPPWRFPTFLSFLVLRSALCVASSPLTPATDRPHSDLRSLLSPPFPPLDFVFCVSF